VNHENTVTFDDIKTLLRFRCYNDDPSLKVKLKDFKEQWQKHNNRLFARSSAQSMTIDTQSEYSVFTSNGNTIFEGNNCLLPSTSIHNNNQAELIDNASSSNLECDSGNNYDFEEIKVAEFLSVIDGTSSQVSSHKANKIDVNCNLTFITQSLVHHHEDGI
jgi:hypothetical protein